MVDVVARILGFMACGVVVSHLIRLEEWLYVWITLFAWLMLVVVSAVAEDRKYRLENRRNAR
jgi:hypothetical protein